MNSLFTIEGVKKTIFGAGALQEVGEACKALKATRALLVMDRDLSKMDICSKVQETLQKSRVKAFLYPEITPEPAPSLADEGAIPEMSVAAMKVERPILNNPRTMSVKVAEDIYKNAFHGNQTMPF